MNKTAIKNFAIWARKKLIADITYKAGLLGISEKGMKSPLPQSTKNVQFFDIGTKDPYAISDIEVKQREVLVETINSKAKSSDYSTAYKAVVEEVAYTWFNRLIAVRFMEINDYLPSRIRVLSSESATKNEPDLVTKPFDTDLDFSLYEKDRIVQLTHETKYDELFRLLFIKQCNALNAILPNLFETTSDFTELLLNVSITDKDGVVYHLVHDIAEDDFNVSKEGQIEIIGWMYQYYNTEPKDEVFALLKNNVKITKERIPAATQLFTPDWIVRYMVENSLGRLWLEGHPNDTLKSGWKYYLDEAEQEAEVQKQLDTIRDEYKTIKPEDIKIIDPCMGSGHILVYAFDVLMQIYESAGYSQRDAAKQIIEHNIYGLDIDNRAYQLSYFAVMMKARQYNRKILNDIPDCHLYSIQESNRINRRQLQYFGVGMNELERNIAIPQLESLLDTFIDAKEYGSILNVENYDWALLYRFVGNVYLDGQMAFEAIGIEDTMLRLRNLIEIGAMMAEKFDVVMTNPPYMGSGGMNDKLANYVKQNYPYSKSDLFSVFIEKSISLTREYGMITLVTMQSWMFLSSFEDMRSRILETVTLKCINHLGVEAFDGIIGKVVSTVAFSAIKHSLPQYKGTAVRLVDFYDSKRSWKEKEFFNIKNHFTFSQADFSMISGNPIAYWISHKVFEIFGSKESIGSIAYPRQGLATGNNDLFLRLWYEVDFRLIGFGYHSVEHFHDSELCYAPYNKGGTYRRWYGNRDLVIRFNSDAYQTLAKQGNHLPSRKFYFKEGFSWSALTTGNFSCRYNELGFVFDTKGSSCFFDNQLLWQTMGYLNSKVANILLKILSPTLDFNCGTISRIPILLLDGMNQNTVEAIVQDNLCISKADWDCDETSWDFTRHPFARSDTLINDRYAFWNSECDARYKALKANEESLNRIFINIYGLQEELMPEVEDKDITVRKADLGRDMRSFISYAVGCMFGRYSLDMNGLAYAGGDWDAEKYTTFIPDKDNILPITDEEYFNDDIVGLFIIFIKKLCNYSA